MVARPGTYQASNNSGELKPELHGRTDLKQFYGGLAYARNIEPVPQGGSRLSPRSRYLGRARRQLVPIYIVSDYINLSGITTATTLRQISFSVLGPLSVAVVRGLTASQTLADILQLQYFDGATWQPLGPAFPASANSNNHTGLRPPGQQVMANAVRLVLLAAPPSSTDFNMVDIIASAESATLTPGRLHPFTFSLTQTYQAIATDFHIDFYRDGVFVGGARTESPASYVPLMSVQQRLDTMLMFNEDIPTLRVLRDRADNQWVTSLVHYENVPRVDLGGTYTNQVVDIWQVYLRFPTTGQVINGDTMNIVYTVNGEQTPAVVVGSFGTIGDTDWPTYYGLVKAAIEGLPSIAPGITVTGSGATGYHTLVISFTGDDNIGGNNTLAAQVVNTAEAAATTSHQQIGKAGGEDLFSNAAGWPACGQFYQDRLVTGGFRSKRGALLASVTGDYFNSNIDLIASSGAILNNLDTDGAERIRAFARSRHLVIFTSDAEYYISDRALSKTVTPTIVNSSRNGCATGVAIVENEGALIYVSRNNALIYAATYDDVSSAYVSSPISLLASHIASDVTSMAMQRASTATDAGRLWMARGDGTMTLGTMLRGESITAFTRWETDGAVRSVMVDGANVTYLLVERIVAGVAELHFERLEQGLVFDGAIEQTVSPRTHITGLEPHEGAVVWAIADGYVTGPFTVAGGAIDLPEASSHVLVGRWTPPLMRTLPLPSEVSERVVLRRPKRVHTVKIDAVDTTSIAVGANGQPARNVALARAGDPVDAPQAPVNRTLTVTGLRGFSDTGQIEITQTSPGQIAWRGITIEART